MACVENIAPMEVDSEMEEGEIVDELSDISSEEEYLLRERLAVLENYNNVLERKKAKRTSVGSGTTRKKEVTAPFDLSEISTTEFEEYCSPHKVKKPQKHQRSLPIIKHHRQKRKRGDSNNTFDKSRDYKKRNSYSRRRVEVKVVNSKNNESSEESEDDYKNSRKKLADAVVVNKPKNDKTSLSERLQKMLCGVNPEPIKFIVKEREMDLNINNKTDSITKFSSISYEPTFNNTPKLKHHNDFQDTNNTCQIIDISTDDDNKTTVTITSVDSVTESSEQKETIRNIIDNAQNVDDNVPTVDKDSDDDLETLRQHALKTKVVNTDDELELLRQTALNTKTVCSNKSQNLPHNGENKSISDDEDSDTTELRLICLKSALIKKAMEMKRKQKLQKRLSQSSNNHDDSLEHIMLAEKINSDNNTDIESVDMDIGSDADDKLKESGLEYGNNNSNEFEVPTEKHIPVLMVKTDDEIEEDEDLLRAKLLTSLSKKLPNLVDSNIITNTVVDTISAVAKQPQASNIPEEKRFIISVESDSEGENEATMNLTKMHMKLSDQTDFQQKLDFFLKSTRKEVEKTTISDVVQNPVVSSPKKVEKFVAKAVKNLPKSEQLEYKYLVKRMTELEKLKQARQSAMNLTKDTLKPKNTTINTSRLSAINNLEEKINLSRKNIAEESAKMLKLKEEGVKLSQKFKIVATELRNIKTALALNKKQQRSVQIILAKIRQHHHMLLKSSLASTHSKVNIVQINKIGATQKENKLSIKNTLDKEIPNVNNRITIQKTIEVKNDVRIEPKQLENVPTKPEAIQHPRLSIEIDVNTNKKVITLTNDNENSEICIENESINDKLNSSNPVVEKGGGTDSETVNKIRRKSEDDYQSPLGAFGSTTWSQDPNAILCPFEVCGDCKDADCKYLHTNPSK